MALPTDYWASFEHGTRSVPDFLGAVQKVSAYQAATKSRFVWRGVADADWPMYSLLVREYITKHGTMPLEPQLREFEKGVLAEAREWRLDWHSSGGRLTALELLAAMQHYSAPTRMLDFTFNPLIALWFAVEKHDDRDGRVFAIDISERLVGRDDASAPEPWWYRIGPGSTTEWTTESWVWRPPPFEPRMVRQEGCFLMGGVPSTQPPRNQRRPGGGWDMLHAAEVRECMSVPFKLINYDQAVAASEGRKLVGKPPKARAFTLRISNKADLRLGLEQAFGYSYSSLFPDFPGLRDYGKSWR